MPTYFNPRRVDIDPGGSEGGGLLAAVLAVIAVLVGWVAAGIWLVHEIMAHAVEIAFFGGLFLGLMGGVAWLMFVQYKRGGGRVEAQLAANRAERAAAADRTPALPAG